MDEVIEYKSNGHLFYYLILEDKSPNFLKNLRDNSINLVITSPPYNEWHNRRTQKRKKKYWMRTNIIYDSFNDKMPEEIYQKWQIDIINELVRIITPDGTICYNHKDRIFNFQVISPLEWILKTKAIFRQRVTWDRCGMQAFNPVRFYRVDEDIYILGKQNKRYKWNKEYAKYLSIWRIPPSRKILNIPTFPEELVKRCILAFTDKNDVVLDPFVGSGTVMKVCRELERSCIGIEISQVYCDYIRTIFKNDNRFTFNNFIGEIC